MKINPSYIDWNNNENALFINPDYKQKVDFSFIKTLFFQGHIFLMTSGTKEKKCVALSKKAFLHSAEAVNRHLKADKKDKWLICLPLFHVGGLSILARSFIADNSVFILKKKWNPSLFLSTLKEKKITLTSLVPTQIYDLVHFKIKAPPSLKAIIVGGGPLHKNLYQSIRKLHWPVLPSYGLTEACSQVATASLNSLHSWDYPDLHILDHCQVKIQKGGYIAIQSQSLLTGWISLSHLEKKSKLPQGKMFKKTVKNEWFLTEDRGELCNTHLKVFGPSQMVKIKGENVSLYKLENLLQGILIELDCPKKYQLLATPHPRAQYQIDLITDHSDLKILSQVQKQYNKKVSSFEKIKNCYLVSHLPKGHKTQVNALKKKIGFS